MISKTTPFFSPHPAFYPHRNEAGGEYAQKRTNGCCSGTPSSHNATIVLPHTSLPSTVLFTHAHSSVVMASTGKDGSSDAIRQKHSGGVRTPCGLVIVLNTPALATKIQRKCKGGGSVPVSIGRLVPSTKQHFTFRLAVSLTIASKHTHTRNQSNIPQTHSFIYSLSFLCSLK